MHATLISGHASRWRDVIGCNNFATRTFWCTHCTEIC